MFLDITHKTEKEMKVMVQWLKFIRFCLREDLRTHLMWKNREKSTSPFPTPPNCLTKCRCLMFNKFLQVDGRSQSIISKVNTEGNPGGPVEYGEKLLRRNEKTQIYYTLGLPSNISQEVLEALGFLLNQFLFCFKILKDGRVHLPGAKMKKRE